MGFPRPAGKYGAEMTSSGGWPDTDEQAMLNRASTLTETLRRLTSHLDTWLHQQGEISSGTIWSGKGATAGGIAIDDADRSMESLQHDCGKCDYLDEPRLRSDSANKVSILIASSRRKVRSLPWSPSA